MGQSQGSNETEMTESSTPVKMIGSISVFLKKFKACFNYDEEYRIAIGRCESLQVWPTQFAVSDRDLAQLFVTERGFRVF